MFCNTSKALLQLVVIFSTIAVVPAVLRHSEVFESWGSTEIRVDKLKYTWTIKDFSFASQKTGEHLNSPTFSAGTDDACKWNLSIYPKGSKEQFKDYVSLFLLSVSCNTMVQYKLSIFNAKQKEINVHNDTDHFVIGSGWGFDKFMEKDFLFNEENEILLNDKLTILCELNVTMSTENKSGLFPTKNQRQLSRNQNYMVKDFTFLLENQTFSDITLSAGGQEFTALKVILATRSPVFKAMFENDVKEINVTRVEISDMNPEILKEMLRYIYTEESPNLDHLACDLLAAADKYELLGLKLMCENSLSENLSIENAADYYVLGDNYSAMELKNQSRDFIIAHASKVANSRGLKAMIETHPHLAEEVFQAVSCVSSPCN